MTFTATFQARSLGSGRWVVVGFCVLPHRFKSFAGSLQISITQSRVWTEESTEVGPTPAQDEYFQEGCRHNFQRTEWAMKVMKLNSLWVEENSASWSCLESWHKRTSEVPPFRFFLHPKSWQTGDFGLRMLSMLSFLTSRKRPPNLQKCRLFRLFLGLMALPNVPSPRSFCTWYLAYLTTTDAFGLVEQKSIKNGQSCAIHGFYLRDFWGVHRGNWSS